MSCRSGVGQTRGATAGPQPLRATVPFKLHKPHTNLRNCKSERTKARQVSPGMRRTMSLDAIVGPYLQGHWPKDPEVQASLCKKDQSTQTPDAWSDKAPSRGGGGHQRSASWGNVEREMAKLKHQLQQQCLKSGVSGGHERTCHHNYVLESYSPVITQTHTPLYKLTPPLHCSVEGLNQELEGMFVCQMPLHQRRILEVPDGHRAPVPLQSCSSHTQSGPSPMPPSSTPSPCSSLSPPTSPASGEDLPMNLDPGVMDGAEGCLPSPMTPSQGGWEPPPLRLSSSPRPNKSYCFQREPPEGCEKVRVCEEPSVPRQARSSLLTSCPDPNKVNFTPHGGSAFCPVSLLKPLLPSIDLLFRSLAVSPATGCFGPGSAAHQAPSPGLLGPQPDSSTAAM